MKTSASWVPSSMKESEAWAGADSRGGQTCTRDGPVLVEWPGGLCGMAGGGSAAACSLAARAASTGEQYIVINQRLRVPARRAGLLQM